MLLACPVAPFRSVSAGKGEVRSDLRRQCANLQFSLQYSSLSTMGESFPSDVEHYSKEKVPFVLTVFGQFRNV